MVGTPLRRVIGRGRPHTAAVGPGSRSIARAPAVVRTGRSRAVLWCLAEGIHHKHRVVERRRAGSRHRAAVAVAVAVAAAAAAAVDVRLKGSSRVAVARGRHREAGKCHSNRCLTSLVFGGGV